MKTLKDLRKHYFDVGSGDYKEADKYTTDSLIREDELKQILIENIKELKKDIIYWNKQKDGGWKDNLLGVLIGFLETQIDWIKEFGNIKEEDLK